jgi:hypothetical protein
MRPKFAAGMLFAQVLWVAWSGDLAQAGEVVLGMPQREVVLALGPPSGVRLERNGVECLTYESDRWRWLAHLVGERTRVIVFKEGRLVDDRLVRSIDIRFFCSRVAGNWDPPMRVGDLCDDRSAHRC